MSSGTALGNLAALAGGFFYALQGLLAKSFKDKVSGYYTAFWQSIVIAIAFSLSLASISPGVILDNWWQLIGIGIFAAGIPTILFMEGIRKVKGQHIFVITSLEPLFGTLLAALILFEFPNPLTVIGGAIILVAIYLISKQKLSSKKMG